MIEALIDKLIHLNIHIELQGHANLKIQPGKTGIPDDVLSEIKQRKPELIRYLEAHQAGNKQQPIPCAPVQESYPLSSGQKSVWLLCQFAEANVAYNIPGMHIWEGALQPDLLSYSFKALIERHEVLRTIFRKDGSGEIKQYIKSTEEAGFTMDFWDLTHADDPEATVNELVRDAFQKSFDLSSDCLIRAGLYKTAPQKWVIVLVMHHIIADAWSMNVLVKELFMLYNAAIRGEADPLPPLRIQYKDYAVWQQHQLAGDVFREHRSYWLQQLQGELPVLELSDNVMRPSSRTYNGATVNKLLDAEISEQVRLLCQEHGATLFMGLLAVVNVLLYKYTGQQDMIIGSPIAGRDHADLDEQIGFYVNLLALRTQFSSDDTFVALLGKVKQMTLDAYQHQAYPFSELADALDVRRDTGRNPLFDVSVIVQNNNTKQADKIRNTQKPAQNASGGDQEAAKFDLTFSFIETGAELQAGIGYNSDIYERETITRMAGHLVELLNAVVAKPLAAIKELEYLTAEEKNKILFEFNNPVSFYPKDKTVLDLFTSWARQTPSATAIIYEREQLSYEALDKRSGLLSSFLIEKGVGREMLVALSVGRGINMLVGILGILKAGAAYVPIDPEYPVDRIRLMMNDTGVEWVITSSQCDKVIEVAANRNILLLDTDWKQVEKQTTLQPPVSPAPEQLAYVIYTSGSTGKPKGVMVEHKGLANMVFNHIDFLELYAGQRVLQFAAFAFDGSCHEIFCTLASGGTLVMLSHEEIHNPVLLGEVIRNNKVDLATFPPSYQEIVKDELSGLPFLYSAGEALTISLGRKMIAKGIQLINGYGPTENSVTATLSRDPVRSDGQITIGRPIKNVQIYILDENRQLAPVGVTGEIYIGGNSLARGYLNDAPLTAAKFIRDPFSANDQSRLYRTGDLGRWLPDGNIIYLGRKDEQVKIRGYRIELNEIVNALQGLPGIQSAAVIARNNEHGEKELVAYITGNGIDITGIREHLNSLLPFYMLPAHFILLEKMPLMNNGKINRKQLPDPGSLNKLPGMEYIAPRNETEEQLVTLWQKILNKKQVGIKDNFFELGGSSLKAMVLIREMMRSMEASISIKALFELKTIAAIAAYLREAEATSNALPWLEGDDHGSLINELSYNQQVYFSHWDNKGEYIVVLNYRYDQLNIEAFRLAVLAFIERHEMFRTRFVRVDGKIKQEVLPVDQVAFTIPDTVAVYSEQEMNTFMEQEYSTRFDLFSFPLFSLKIYNVVDRYYNVVLTMHHILADGYSEGIIKEELVGLYTAMLEKRSTQAATLPFQYRHFSNWQQKFVCSPEGIAQKDYWFEKLQGFHQTLTIFPLLPAVGRQNNVIAIPVVIKNIFYEDLDRYTRKQGLTRAALLMGSLVLLFNRLTGKEDITILMPVSGRNSKYYGALDVAGLAGDFTNLLLVRNSINSNDTLAGFLRKVQLSLLEDLQHDTYPFGRLMAELPGVPTSFSLQHSISFNYHNYHFFNDMVYEREETGHEIKRPGDIPIMQAFSLAVTEFSNCLQLHLVFNEDLFDKERRTYLKDLYFHILRQAVYFPERAIHSIDAPVLQSEF